jgi:hypothetical protein
LCSTGNARQQQQLLIYYKYKSKAVDDYILTSTCVDKTNKINTPDKFKCKWSEPLPPRTALHQRTNQAHLRVVLVTPQVWGCSVNLMVPVTTLECAPVLRWVSCACVGQHCS